MEDNYSYNEFYDIVDDILKNEEFLKLKEFQHHGLNRYDHSMRVALVSYEVAKYFHLDYVKTARGALLHDFFLESKDNSKLKTLFSHPNYALETAKKHFDLSELEKDIIKTHMFPIGIKLPKYLESWIVDIADDIVAIYEKCHGIRKSVSFATSFLFFMFMNSLK